MSIPRTHKCPIHNQDNIFFILESFMMAYIQFLLLAFPFIIIISEIYIAPNLKTTTPKQSVKSKKQHKTLVIKMDNWNTYSWSKGRNYFKFYSIRRKLQETNFQGFYQPQPWQSVQNNTYTRVKMVTIPKVTKSCSPKMMQTFLTNILRTSLSLNEGLK